MLNLTQAILPRVRCRLIYTSPSVKAPSPPEGLFLLELRHRLIAAYVAVQRAFRAVALQIDQSM